MLWPFDTYFLSNTIKSECKNLHALSHESILKLKIVETILKLCHLFGQIRGNIWCKINCEENITGFKPLLNDERNSNINKKVKRTIKKEEKLDSILV